MKLSWVHRRVQEELAKAEEGKEEAREAAIEAVDAYKRAEQRAEEVKPMMNEIKQHRRVNHFTEMFEQAFRGRK